MSRYNELCQQYLAHSLRPYIYKHADRFPMQNYLRLLYNDALTYDAHTKKGGVKASLNFKNIARAPQNRDLQLLFNELAYLKKSEEDIVLDKVSVSDYITSAAVFVVGEAEGPNMIPDITYGRTDAKTEAEAGSVDNIPSAGNFASNLKAKGFDSEEVVALASIPAFGKVWDPKKRDTSKYPKLDNYYYKQLLSSNSGDIILSGDLTGDQELKVIVEKFA